jgi:hypothetical protein
MEQLEIFNTNMPLAPINLDDAYTFTSLLFYSLYKSVKPNENVSEPILPPYFLSNRNRFINVENEGSGLQSIGKAKIKA